MAQLRDDAGAFRRLRTEIVVIGPEDARAFAEYWEKEKLPFTGLPDPRRRVLRLYGQEVKLLRWGRMPAQAIIDRRGVVRYAHFGDSMRDIPENREILDLLRGLEE